MSIGGALKYGLGGAVLGNLLLGPAGGALAGELGGIYGLMKPSSKQLAQVPPMQTAGMQQYGGFPMGPTLLGGGAFPQTPPMQTAGMQQYGGSPAGPTFLGGGGLPQGGMQIPAYPPEQAPGKSGIPWGKVLVGGALALGALDVGAHLLGPLTMGLGGFGCSPLYGACFPGMGFHNPMFQTAAAYNYNTSLATGLNWGAHPYMGGFI